MRPPARPGLSPRLARLAGLALLAAGCHIQPAVKPFDDPARRAEDALRAFGQPWFDVVSFRAERGEYRFEPDGYHRGTSLYVVPYSAEVRYRADTSVPSRTDTLARFREPGAALKDVEQDIALRRLLGTAPHPGGSTQGVRGIAVFEEVESGWRVVAVDGSLPQAPN